MSPIEAQKPGNYKTMYTRLYGSPQKNLQNLSKKDLIPKFEMGDCVRISLHKRMFEKDSTAHFSEEIYEVSEVVQTTRPITYRIRDLMGEPIDGTFYKEQLLKTDQTIYRIDQVLRRRTNKTTGKKQVLVRWMGYPSKFDSWEDSDTIHMGQNNS